MAVNRLPPICVFLLLLCLPGTGRGADAASVAAENNLSAGLALVRDHKNAEALPLLKASAASLDGFDRRAALNRLLGHLLWDEATTATTAEERNRLFDKAGEHYRLAATDGDQTARRHYLSLESLRSPERGFAAGWQYLNWNGAFAIDGWLVIAGNYGAVITGGKGIPGLIDLHPLHALVWVSLIVLLLVFAFISYRHGLDSKTRPVPARAIPPEDVSLRNKIRTPLPAKRPPVAGQRQKSSASHPSPPALRSPRSAAPIPAAKVLNRTPRPDLEHLRLQHQTAATPEKNETELYERGEVLKRVRQPHETDPGSPLMRKSRGERDETEADGTPVLPPGGKPPPPPRRSS